ncbi:G-type lectin S-receptor-like serine/threonine-protein kinase At4g27290 [Elaeis guineensis]|uniref:G-type lectin S-receptor-like serine/threonine-protein kinase At4g27290 n=1 Tax=Elaeis guineensis var. tenera TaxID=51953 RepID=UPI003C6D98D4
MGKFRILATFLCLSFFNLFSASNGRDIITPDQAMENGEALVSAGGTFKLGFFSPSGSTNRYLGIWYNNIPMQTVVWVANRNSPVTNFPAVLNLTADGNLALHDNTSNVIWLTNTSNVSDPTVQLLDSGNLVLTDNSRRLVWQSFDYPSDTFLPGMKLGFNQHLDWHLTSWTSPSDPSPGTYSSKIYGYREIGIWNLTILKYRSGPWNGHGFNGFTDMKSAEFFSFRFFINQEEEYYTFEIINKSILSRVVLNQFGVVQRSVLLDPIHGWKLYWWFPMDQCDEYAECGAFGVCNTNDSSVCKCLRGFVPKSPEDWALRDFSDGCVRRTALHCGRGGDGFLKVTGLKLPDTSNAMVDRNMSLDDCRDRCLKNCSCMAFNSFSEDGSACLTWHGDLIDIREFTEGGQDLYVRLASSELGMST